MKVLVVTPYVANVYGGPARSVIGLARELGKLGLEIDVVTTNANGSSSLNVLLKTWIQESSYRIRYFPRWALKKYTISLSMASWLFRHIHNYDIVHTNTIFSFPVLPAHLACQRQRIPYVRTPRGMLEPWAMSYKAWKKRSYYNYLERPALEKAKAIHALTPTEATNMKSLGLNVPMFVIPNGIDQNEFEPTTDCGEFFRRFPAVQNLKIILFLGRIDPKKGLDLLAQAYNKVYNRFPQTCLVIAGPDNTNFLTTAKNYFNDLNCRDRVIFTGMLSGIVKNAALTAASLFVAPSYSEGFSMSVLEGMASALPCVITDGCNFPEAAQAKVAHVVSMDHNALANAMIDCLNNPQQAEELGKQAQRFVFENYSLKSCAERLARTYHIILDRDKISQAVP